MKLTDLNFRRSKNPDADYAVIVRTGERITVWRASDGGGYTIWKDSLGHPLERWINIDPATAQAVLYSLGMCLRAAS
jgi:hypothetical protein